VVNLVCDEYDVERICDTCDVVYTALPHKIPMRIVPQLIARGKKVIDLSADFRFKNAEAYEEHYQPHTSRELLDQAVYGLCEVYRDQIRNANLIGNPGCYPTSLLLPLIPVLKAGLINSASIIADSKSGVSGAGRSLSLATHFCEANEGFKAYKIAAHRHNPEMNEILSEQAGRPVRITFVPHLIPATRGMLSTIYADLTKTVPADDIESCLRAFYTNSSFVRICSEDTFPNIANVKGTNFCDIGFRIDSTTGRLVLISAIDNLVKGAAGQAVQNMNLMLDMEETAGLDAVPFPL
jgi:N-acetyl-gamma-glutamyl-phosphate reductase